ncbi:MAG TPA: fructose-1,6-bisphosphate aldolase/phosphatase [Candidatus Thermoplasmatota archaeon]|nr:fructose-1,6-bisphosphate aldolase/phosphatase [Candidatus Thermoplasmatota archaeon]
MSKVTFSIIKADVGGWPGHSTVHPDLIDACAASLDTAVETGVIEDFLVTHVGDDIDLIMSHRRGVDNPEVHQAAYKAFLAGTATAKKLKLYGAGQDLLSDSFAGNVRGMGPGVAEFEFTERPSEPVIAFLMDKTEPGAFNMPIYKMFADPWNTPGLVIDPNMNKGFIFEVWDIETHQAIFLSCPEEMYTLLSLIGAKSKYVIKRVFPKKGHKLPHNEPVAVVSTEKLVEVAGEYVGKDDPVAAVRAQSGLPAVGEVLEPFSFPHLVSGWMRGSHNGPLMPVGLDNANCTRFDGPPRVVGLGFNVANGQIGEPNDLFADIAYDNARKQALHVTDYMRRHGPFEPHRLSLADMEYTTISKVQKELQGRWTPIDQVARAEIRVIGEVE